MPVNSISSLANPKVKNVVKLRKRRERDQQQLMIIEGQREIEKAIQAGVVIKELFTSGEDYLGLDTNNSVNVYSVSDDVFDKILVRETTETVLAVAQIPQKSLSDLESVRNPLYVVVESVEKPGNLGAILRSCDGAGVTAVLVCDPKTDIYNPNTIRASIGTIFTVPTVSASSDDVLDFLKAKSITTFTATPLAQADYTTVDWSNPAAVVVGCEDKGVSDFWITNTDQKISIPMKGVADSLNVSVSTAVVIYEVFKATVFVMSWEPHVILPWLGVFGIGFFMLLENALPARQWTQPKWRRWLINFFVSFCNLLIVDQIFVNILKRTEVFKATFSWDLFGYFHLNSTWRIVCTIVILDFMMYAWHRLNHVVPFFWRFHKVIIQI